MLISRKSTREPLPVTLKTSTSLEVPPYSVRHIQSHFASLPFDSSRVTASSADTSVSDHIKSIFLPFNSQSTSFQRNPSPPSSIHLKLPSPVTRSHKFTDRDHAGIAEGTAQAESRLPRYFAKSGHSDADPTKTKKGGSGKGNWGAAGDELEDIRPNMANARRRSNSSTHNMKDFKTKFETIETEPVFEEELHGPMGEELEKQSTTSTDKSVDEEDNDKKL